MNSPRRPRFDHRAAVELAGEIARLRAPTRRCSRRPRRRCRTCAPRLPRAPTGGSKAIAERRFAVMRNALHVLTLPRFGKRESPDKVLTPEEHHRRLLGLPLDRRLFGPEINAAYKHAAKKVHPDAGGSERDFLALSQARDALMKRV